MQKGVVTTNPNDDLKKLHALLREAAEISGRMGLAAENMALNVNIQSALLNVKARRGE